ncbi:molybdenum cofactor biosynthesis protein MoaE [Neisseriaceae bacterium ESL0693]|nr:molybdenum cofactor biosynthesis protein MoaE [Neisseriaceae bacterium ESL0693]
MHVAVSVQEDDFNLTDELASFRNIDQDCGAVVSFIGQVRGRDATDKHLSSLFLTHLPGATEKAIEDIIHAAAAQWSLSYVKVIHRVGHLASGDQIVLVLTASAHRDDAYQANRYIMDYLKIEAPFWKKERFDDGSEYWVDMKNSDRERITVWQ